MTPGRDRRAPLAYRIALRALPEWLRVRHGRAMEEAVRAELDRTAWYARPWVLAGAVVDAILRGRYERTRHSGGGGRTMGRFTDDLRHAIRTLGRSPRFTATAVVTLALGIGANSALFSVVHAVLLQDLPYPEADRVTHLSWDRGEGTRGWVPHWKVEFWRERSNAFEALTTWSGTTREIGEEPGGVTVGTLLAGRDFFDVTGFQPVLGRALTPEDHVEGAADVALISTGFWERTFGSSPDVLGRTVQIGGRPHTVVGVLPPEWRMPQDPDVSELVLPLRIATDPTDERENWPLMGRLARGVDTETANADLARVTEEFRRLHPELINPSDVGMRVASYTELFAGSVAPALWALMGATVLVLLISCANVAMLLLARGEGRRTEMAVRSALGAGRGRILGQILAESLVLSIAAAAVGLAVARVGVDALLALYPSSLPRGETIGLDGAVVGYTLGAALLTGVVFGLVSAAPSLRTKALRALRSGSRGATGSTRLRTALVAVESAVAVVLLVGAGLLIGTLVSLVRVDPGYRVDDVVTVRMPTPSGGWEDPAQIALEEEQLLARLQALDAVVSAAATSAYPLTRGLNIPVGIAGRPEDYEGAVEWRAISPSYFDVLEIELLRGRSLTPADRSSSTPVAVVNRAFADRWFPGEDPVGRRIEIGRYRQAYVIPGLDVGGTTIVGVVENVLDQSLRSEGRRTVFVPSSQVPPPLASSPFVVARLAPDASPAAIASAIGSDTGGLPDIRSLSGVVRDSIARERFNAILMIAFAAVALILTALGIYGVVSYGTRQRTREIGIRIALGASRTGVQGRIVREGLAPVLVGTAIGVVGAVWLGGFVRSLLWGVEPAHPWTLVGVGALITLVAVAATWLPARAVAIRAPGDALRAE